MELKEIQEKCQRENKNLRIVNEKPTFIKKEPIKADTKNILRDLNIDLWKEGKWNDNSIYDPNLGIDIIPVA